MLGLLFAVFVLQSGCASSVDASALLDGNHRFVVVGELHGTTETPRAFSGLVCEAASSGPVTVALELPQAMQPQLDAFLSADSDTTALASLDGTPFVDPTFIDGRTSVAMLEMMQSLRRLKAEGRDIALHAFQPSSPMPKELPQAYYELEMGYLLSRAIVDRPEARVLALVGNLHARKMGLAAYPELRLPASAHLPADQTLTVYVAYQGGEAWNCASTCGVRPAPERYDVEARGVIMGSYGEGAYDAVLALGPATASRPFLNPAP